jgi:outer membrane protein assembly factor BamE (lipoprotein component of BamABCDE complex)
MTLRLRRAVLSAAMIGAAIAAGGCTRTLDFQGHVLDDTLVASVQPGVDNRDSVAATLGRPSFVGQFDQRDWYYVSRTNKQLAFANPRPTEQTVLHVRFDEAGNVVSVQRTGLEQVASIWRTIPANNRPFAKAAASLPPGTNGQDASARRPRRRARPASPGPRPSRSSPRPARASTCRSASARSLRRRLVRAAASPRGLPIAGPA